MKNYFLPDEMKLELRKIWGIPIFGSKKEVVKKYQKIIKERGFKKIITVGDYCSRNLSSNVKIFDGKIKRRKIKKILNYSLGCQNRAGTIQKEVWPILKKAIKREENVFVNGEEDLLVIPTVLLSGKNNAVIYGFPGKGICLIKVSPQIKKVFKELLKKFRTK